MPGSLERSRSWRSRAVVRWLAMTPLLVLMLASMAPAQVRQGLEDVDSPGLLIEASAGWDGTVDRSMPVPVSFLIRNDTDAMIEGELRLADPANGHEVLLGEVVVAAHTARRLTSIQAMSDWFECFATLRDGDRALWRRELPLTTGSEFFESVNFALFIDDGGRRLELPGAVTGTTPLAMSETEIAGEAGRPTRCLSVKTWQVPNHFGPLLAVQAMIFPEGAAEDQLNQVQWQAVADWMCQGGVVFVHADSDDIVARLLKSAPLDRVPAERSGPFVVRRSGLGGIYEYAAPLLPSSGGEVRRQIGDAVAKMARQPVISFLNSVNGYYLSGGQADLNRFLVVGFFGLYTFFSGFVALLLFRLSQRRMGMYAIGVVVSASVLSGLMGGYLRLSRGDLYWTTITQAGAGGVVQVGRIEVQSAGGRNTRVAVNGEHADLQSVDWERRYSPWNHAQSGLAPFTWQSNVAAGAEDTYQVNVTMTPWGRRQLHATGYRRGLEPLDFQLEFDPRMMPSGRRNEAAGDSAGLPSGVFRLKLVNQLPCDFRDCWLVIGVTVDSSALPPPAPQPVYRRGGMPMPPSQPGPSTGDGLVDVYQQRSLNQVVSGGTHEETFAAQFGTAANNWDQMIHVSGGSLPPPRIAHLGDASAWIFALIDDSQVMTIDEERTDFIPQQHLHLFVQQIRPEDMPDASLFRVPDDAAKPDTATDGTQ